MDYKSIIFSLILILISNLSISQTDSLNGKQVTVHFHKTKKTITGEYRSYKDNRVTVLFDMSLHDYFYTEIKILKFEDLNLTFDEKGKIAVTEVQQLSKSSDSDQRTEYVILEKKELVISEKFGTKSHRLDLNEKIKITLKNGDKVKGRNLRILDQETVSLNREIIKLIDIKEVKGTITTSIARELSGRLITTIGYFLSATIIYTLPGIGIVYLGKEIRGKKKFNLYDRWKVEIK